MALYSPYWYRAALLRPRLKRHCDVARQVHRGRIWYVVANRATGEFFRVTPPAYTLIGLMDGRRTIEAIWREAADALGDNLPTQDEVIELLARLHNADLLNSGAAPDLSELADRRRRRQRMRYLSMFKNPFAIRLPLLDPDRFLTRWMPAVAPVFTLLGALMFAALIAYATALAALNWSELSADLSSRLAASETLLLIVLAYPLIKAAHELGHGFAIKQWGGEVREMGVIFLFLMPVPYVDASAATQWPGKWHRALVSAMGVFTELAISAVAMIIWVNAEPGIVRAVAFITMVTGGISTLLFNGNPLLRFDGYYVLSDLAEIPNLAQRSNNYIGHLVKRYAFGLSRERFPALAPGEPAWLVGYGVAAYLYKLLIAAAIALLVSGWLFELGILLAAWAIFQMILLPAFKSLKYVLTGEALMNVRRRAVGTTFGTIAVVLALASLAPLPYGEVARAVIWAGDNAAVVAAGSGFVKKVEIVSGHTVKPRAPIYVLESTRLSAQRDAAAAQLDAMRARLEAERAASPASAQRAREQIVQSEALLARLDRQLADLVVRSPATGRFTPSDPRPLEGRYVEQGTTLGYVVDKADPVLLRIVVPESAVDLIRERRRSVEVRFPHLPDKTFTARIERQLPSLDDVLPSPALSSLGRGPFQVDPTKPEELRSITRFAVFEAKVVNPPPNLMIGASADVRIDLGWAPLLVQVSRPVLQVLLKAVAG